MELHSCSLLSFNLYNLFIILKKCTGEDCEICEFRILKYTIVFRRPKFRLLFRDYITRYLLFREYAFRFIEFSINSKHHLEHECIHRSKNDTEFP